MWFCIVEYISVFFFFFQAEDGIRDLIVTRVQTCALPISELGEEGRALAGGHSLIPMMKLRLASPAHLVDLGGVADLKGIRSDGGDIVIGAMTTQHELVGSELLGAKLPILRETALVI